MDEEMRAQTGTGRVYKNLVNENREQQTINAKGVGGCLNPGYWVNALHSHVLPALGQWRVRSTAL